MSRKTYAEMNEDSHVRPVYMRRKESLNKWANAYINRTGVSWSVLVKLALAHYRDSIEFKQANDRKE